MSARDREKHEPLKEPWKKLHFTVFLIYFNQIIIFYYLSMELLFHYYNALNCIELNWIEQNIKKCIVFCITTNIILYYVLLNPKNVSGFVSGKS